MTDQSPPRPVRANPAPRRALPRVKPLAAVPEDDERVLWAAAHAEGTGDVSLGGEAATGRDLLIPNGPTEPEAKAQRKGRGSVPTLSELMPPSTPRRKKGGHAEARHETPADSMSPPSGAEATASGAGAPAEERTLKKGELLITLPKPLRKRLKAKAAGHGMTSEQAVTELISVWVDG